MSHKNFEEQDDPCYECSGTGERDGEECPFCLGTGWPRDLPFGDGYFFVNVGGGVPSGTHAARAARSAA
jgi:DnaJ-class molecular chaperone